MTCHCREADCEHSRQIPEPTAEIRASIRKQRRESARRGTGARTMNKAMQDDVARQESAGRLVAAEVLACASQLVHEIEREEAYELLSRPVYACPECEDEGLEGEACDKGCGSIDIPATYEETDPREAYEHWIVSEWLAGKLAEQGEITGELLGLTIWGRCCTGQAIKLDEVMQQIALEVGR